ncbi:MAG: chorismate mutase [Hyphomonadaceae bacterium]
MDDGSFPQRAFAAPGPEMCRTMTDVRAGVDEVDAMLVALIRRRQGYMDAAARIKPERALVRDEARIAQVLSNVKRHAEKAGLSWDIAEPVWRTMIERCIAHELVEYDRLQAQSSAKG